MNKVLVKKLSIVLVIVVFLICFKFFGLSNYLTLDYLRSSQEKFQVIYSAHPVMIIFIYLLIYIISTALSFPGAAILTLAGGALFGFWMGTIVVSFASSIGATIACFVARFLLRDWVEVKFDNILKVINEGIEKEGGFYLFTLRLIPVFPFFVINLVMGLTRLTLWRFYFISQVGMLAGTMVYVNAGKEMSKIDSLKDIMSPTLFMSFVVLGLFPIIVRKILAYFKKRGN